MLLICVCNRYCGLEKRVMSLYFVRFKVLTAMSMKMVVFWDVAPRSLVDTDRHFGGVYYLYHQGD
jgi:hypothetical protein